jgi:alternate signal-mediated exported protein
MSAMQRFVASITAMLSLIVGGYVTLALWNAEETQASAGIITAGQLALVPETFSWAETSSDILQDYRASGTDLTSLAAFQAMPGDSLVIRQGMRITAEGNNLNYDMVVDWTKPTEGEDVAYPNGMTVSYQVLDGQGLPAKGSTATPIGTPVEIKTLPEGNGVYTVVITIDYAEGAPLEYASGSVLAGEITIPAFTVSTIQVRGT